VSNGLTMSTVALQLANRIRELEYGALPDAVVQVAKHLLLDQVGVQLRGATLPHVQPVRRLVEMMGAREESTISYYGTRTVAPYAAYVNGTFAHSCEFDDAHPKAWHAGSVVVPAALAFAEKQGSSGKALITGIVAGCQAMSFIGAPMFTRMVRTGWHGMKVLGVFGAAAAVGKLLGLDAKQLVHAFAIAASDAGGTMEYDQTGGEVKRLHAGLAARSGAQAALLAQDGFTGPPTIFEGPRGIFKVFAEIEKPELEQFLEPYHILDTEFKLYPAVGTTHATIDALRELQKRDSFAHEDVEEVDVGLSDWVIVHGASITRPTDMISAQFSLAYGVALCLVRRSNTIRDYADPSLWQHKDILSMIDKVRTHVVTFGPEESDNGAIVTVKLKDGRVLTQHQRVGAGRRLRKVSYGEIKEKFVNLASDVVSAEKTENILRLTKTLESSESVRPLLDCLRVCKP
jgi:2-methylcitrate dehydratase PrpD